MHRISELYLRRINAGKEVFDDMRKHYVRVLSGWVFERILRLKEKRRELVCNLSAQGLSARDCVIWGCGNYGKLLHSFLDHYGVHVKGFYDNDPHNEGRIINGVPVLRFIEKRDDEVVVISVQTAEKEIGSFLDDNGLKHNIDYYLFSDLKRMIIDTEINVYGIGRSIL